MAGAVDALAAHAGGIEEAKAPATRRGCAPEVEAGQRTARRNVHLFTPANRSQLVAREAVLRLAARPFLVSAVRRLLNREGERL